MERDWRTGPVSSELDRELRSTLAALDELGPAYEQEIAIALRDRLRRYNRPPAIAGRPADGAGWSWFYLPLAAAALLMGAAMFSSAARVHSQSWAVPVHREWRYWPIDRSSEPAPGAPVVPSAPPALPGTY